MNISTAEINALCEKLAELEQASDLTSMCLLLQRAAQHIPEVMIARALTRAFIAQGLVSAEPFEKPILSIFHLNLCEMIIGMDRYSVRHREGERYFEYIRNNATFADNDYIAELVDAGYIIREAEFKEGVHRYSLTEEGLAWVQEQSGTRISEWRCE